MIRAFYFAKNTHLFLLCNFEDMDAEEIQQLKTRWETLTSRLADQFGEAPDLQALIFLIGVQELGKGPQKFSKDEKQDIMHIATCKLLSQFGYYELAASDQDGWPHWNLIRQ